MKRIEAFIRDTKLSSVVDALKTVGVGGLTITKSQGLGAGERPQLRSGRGTGTVTAEYSLTDSIITVIEDSKLEPTVSAIMNAASTGNKGDGKVFVTTIDDAYDIANKQKTSGRI
jgi:nitrogen regulatory protein P-II 1